MFTTREPCIIQVETDYSKAVFGCLLALIMYWTITSTLPLCYSKLVNVSGWTYIKCKSLFRNRCAIVSQDTIDKYKDL
jgi:hypothetical protein